MPGASTSSFSAHACAAFPPSRRTCPPPAPRSRRRSSGRSRARRRSATTSSASTRSERVARAARFPCRAARAAGARGSAPSPRRGDDVEELRLAGSAALSRRVRHGHGARSVVQVDGDVGARAVAFALGGHDDEAVGARRRRQDRRAAQRDRLDRGRRRAARGNSRRGRSADTILRATDARGACDAASPAAARRAAGSRGPRRNRRRTGTTPDCPAAGTRARRRCGRCPAGLDGRIATPWIASSPDLRDQPRRVVLAADARAAGDEDHVGARRDAAPRESRPDRRRAGAALRARRRRGRRGRAACTSWRRRSGSGPFGAPGRLTSLPVTMMRTRGCSDDATLAPGPSDAMSPTSCGRRRRPAASAGEPCAMSSPRCPTCWPGATGRVIVDRARRSRSHIRRAPPRRRPRAPARRS